MRLTLQMDSTYDAATEGGCQYAEHEFPFGSAETQRAVRLCCSPDSIACPLRGSPDFRNSLKREEIALAG